MTLSRVAAFSLILLVFLFQLLCFPVVHAADDLAVLQDSADAFYCKWESQKDENALFKAIRLYFKIVRQTSDKAQLNAASHKYTQALGQETALLWDRWHDDERTLSRLQLAYFFTVYPTWDSHDPLTETDQKNLKKLVKQMKRHYRNLNLDPQQVETHLNLAKKLEALPTYSLETITEYTEALRLQPNNPELARQIKEKVDLSNQKRQSHSAWFFSLDIQKGSQRSALLKEMGDKIIARTKACLQAPKSLRENRTGEVGYRFSVDGKLLGLRIETSSGDSQFDASLLNAIKAAFPCSFIEKYFRQIEPYYSSIYVSEKFEYQINKKGK